MHTGAIHHQDGLGIQNTDDIALFIDLTLLPKMANQTTAASLASAATVRVMYRMRWLVEVGTGLVDLVRVFPVEPFGRIGSPQTLDRCGNGVDAEPGLQAIAHHPQVLVQIDLQQLQLRTIGQRDPGQVLVVNQDRLPGVLTGHNAIGLYGSGKHFKYGVPGFVIGVLQIVRGDRLQAGWGQ